jgi:IclR family pca regulon transcriptional regulator
MQPEPSGEFVQSLARGLDVIRAFSADAPSMTLSDIAKTTGLTRATARRFLLTLLELGYLRSDGKVFALTPRVLELGFSYLTGLTLPEVAQPHLERLSRDLGESTSAAVLDGDDIVYVARVPTRRIMTVGITIGTRFPAYATSMGRVLLSGLPVAESDAYLEALTPVSITAATLTDRRQLAAELQGVRERGYTIVDQELEAGLRSVAAPVRRDGAVMAAINVSTTSGATPLERIVDEFVPALVAAAEAIGADLDTTALTTVHRGVAHG